MQNQSKKPLYLDPMLTAQIGLKQVQRGHTQERENLNRPIKWAPQRCFPPGRWCLCAIMLQSLIVVLEDTIMNLSVELGPESLLGQVSFVEIGPGSFTLNKSLIDQGTKTW